MGPLYQDKYYFATHWSIVLTFHILYIFIIVKVIYILPIYKFRSIGKEKQIFLLFL